MTNQAKPTKADTHHCPECGGFLSHEVDSDMTHISWECSNAACSWADLDPDHVDQSPWAIVATYREAKPTKAPAADATSTIQDMARHAVKMRNLARSMERAAEAMIVNAEALAGMVGR